MYSIETMDYQELLKQKYKEWGKKTRLSRMLMDLVNGYLIFIAEKMKAFDLGLSEYPLIIYLYHFSTPDNPSSQIDLARNLKRDKALIARAVSSLVKKGYLETATNQQRKNTKNVCLTPKGSEIAPELMDIVNQWEENVLCPANEGTGEFLDQLKALYERAEVFHSKVDL